jgi:hypothetical protein
MGRAPLWIALGEIFRHDSCLSVMLFEVDPAHVASGKFERDAPRAVDVDCVARGIKPLEPVKVRVPAARSFDFSFVAFDLVRPAQRS